MAKRSAGMTAEVAPDCLIFSIRPPMQSKIPTTKAFAAKSKPTQARQGSKQGVGGEEETFSNQMALQINKYPNSRLEIRDSLSPTLKQCPEVNLIGESCNDSKSNLSTTMQPPARHRVIEEWSNLTATTNTIIPMNRVPDQHRTLDWSRGRGNSRHEGIGHGCPHLRHKMSLPMIIEK